MHPDVADCLVVGVPDERFGEAVTAVVSLRAGAQATPDDLAGGARVARAVQAPAPFVVVPEVVRGPNGKADYVWARARATREKA